MRGRPFTITLVAIGVVFVAASSFCWAAPHHMLFMVDASGACNVATYLSATLPQAPDYGKVFLVLALLVFAYGFVLRTPRKRSADGCALHTQRSGGSREAPQSPLQELFRRGILNPKIFDAAVLRL